MDPVFRDYVGEAHAGFGLFAGSYAIVEIWEAERIAQWHNFLVFGNERYELDHERIDPDALPVMQAMRAKWDAVNAKIVV